MIIPIVKLDEGDMKILRDNLPSRPCMECGDMMHLNAINPTTVSVWVCRRCERMYEQRC